MQPRYATSLTTTASLTAPTPVLRIVPCAPAHDHVPDYAIQRGEYKVEVARSPHQRMQATRLIERMYSWRGYRTAAMAAPLPTATRATFVASAGPEVRGTLTLALDTETGLLADGLYADEIDRFRVNGRKVCELSKLAVSPEHSSKELLASLIQLAHVYARVINDASDAFIEVNPRHAAFYQRMLGFRRIGDVRNCDRVGAPAVLLHLDLAYMDDQIRRHRDSLRSQGRSLYPYFLSWDPADWPHDVACAA